MPSIFQKISDNVLKQQHSAYTLWIEYRNDGKGVLSYKSPLYGRRTENGNWIH